jgi:D-3-phosphoglycerate dehydrogenase/glyoxylate/hydroxypyruvate reductase A
MHEPGRHNRRTMAILVMTAPLPAAQYVDPLRAIAGDVPVWTPEEPHDRAAVEAILAWRMKPGVLVQYPNLRVLCAVAAGVDKLLKAGDIPPLVPVTRVVDPHQCQQIAQYVVGVTLRFTRDLPRYAEQQARALWERHRTRPASACRIGVLGLGSVGQGIANAFMPLGYPVAGWSRSARPLAGVTTHAGELGLAALLAHTDVLVCALPLTEFTRGLLRRETLAQLPRGAYVINVGRGEQMVEADLRALLDEGHLAGAALDVFEREPPPADNWVWSHPKVLATPHIAGEVSREVVAKQTLEALRLARAGLPQPRAVDRSAGY